MRKKPYGVERAGQKGARSNVERDRSLPQTQMGPQRLSGTPDAAAHFASRGPKSLMKTTNLATRGMASGRSGRGSGDLRRRVPTDDSGSRRRLPAARPVASRRSKSASPRRPRNSQAELPNRRRRPKSCDGPWNRSPAVPRKLPAPRKRPSRSPAHGRDAGPGP